MRLRWIVLLASLSTASLCAQTISASARAEWMGMLVVPMNGQQAEVALPVDACDTLRVVTHFGSDKPAVRFVKPDGTVLPWAEGTSGLAFQKSELPKKDDGTPGGFVYEAFLTAPDPGPWKLVLDWGEPQWAGNGTIVYATWLGSRIEMNVLVPGTAFAAGTPVAATLALMENRIPRYVAVVQASLYRDGALVGPVTFTLQDFPDLKAKSLISDLNASQPGHYVLKVEATGQGATGPFRRSAMTDFDIFTPTGKITGAFSSEVK